MRLTTRLTPFLLLGLSPALALTGCGKGPEPIPAAPSPAAPAPPAGLSAQGDASSTPAVAETFVFAKLPGREVTDADVAPRLKAGSKPGQPPSGQLIMELVEDIVDDALLVADARAAGFEAPADATGDEAIAEAWAKHKFLAAAQASVSDADLAVWFAERRGMARIVFKDEETAAKTRAEIEAQIAKGEGESLSHFLAAKGSGRHQDVVPDGVLVDAQGNNELGQPVLPEDGARVLFALAKNGDISPPSKVGDMWLLIMQVGARPGTPIDQVPGDQKDAAKEKIAAARAMAQLEEYVARLRKDQGVSIDELAVRKYARTLGVESLGKVKRLPFGARKAQFQRQRQPNRAPTRPAGRDIERIIQERAKAKMHGQDASEPAGQP